MILINCDAIDDEKRIELLKLEIYGYFFVSALAIVLHFLYDWSGKAFYVSFFSAVNESIWEHVKIFSLPFLFWAFVELCCVRIPFRKFVASKVISLYFIVISIPVFYYAYSGIFGMSVTSVDIASGFVFTLIAFIFSYRMITKLPCIERYYKISIILLTVFCFMIVYFTYLPPKIELFRDPITGEYGI